MTKLEFGKNIYDKCPELTERYHVIDVAGFIRWKSAYGFAAFDHAGNLSDSERGIEFRVVDTRDGSEYGAYLNGEAVR